MLRDIFNRFIALLIFHELWGEKNILQSKLQINFHAESEYNRIKEEMNERNR